MTQRYYKAVRLDKTSHYDKTTLWTPGAVIEVSQAQADAAYQQEKRHRPPSESAAWMPKNPCGTGIHGSPSLLEAVGYQRGPSLYCTFEGVGEPISVDDTPGKRKARFRAVRVGEFLTPEETDREAGLKLWEANHPVNPLLLPSTPLPAAELETLLRQWASVWDSVWDSVWASVWASVRASVWDSVWDSVGDSVRASVGDSVWDSVWNSVGAYVGGLFPSITTWRSAEAFGPDPWRPLLTLWYAGYVPSFDGRIWRLHVGTEARVVLEWTPETDREEVPR